MNPQTTHIAHLSPIKQAFLALEEMQAKLAEKENNRQEAIAIVGMGCRFPGGGNDPETFWQQLQEGMNSRQKTPENRWKSKGKGNFGNFLTTPVDEFDAPFFSIAPREAKHLDPQQRLLLEVSWEALEYAGIAPNKLKNSQTGVFIGINTSDYLQLQLNQGKTTDLDAYAFTGNTPSVAAGRLSYYLGLQGPTLAVDTACSSSLVAVHLACQSLRNQECSLALAGGVNLMLAPQSYRILAQMQALAKDGRCKTFDASADGYGRGEGCGIVLLKRYQDAIADQDQILAVIRGTAINHDGASSGLTVPNGLAQEKVIQEALANARIEPHRVSYVEVHGTGTSLGDPIEVEALSNVYGCKRTQDNPLLLGSVKTNIGHLEAAAGIASLIKVVLSLQHQELPPHLHLQTLNPAVSWENLPLRIVTERTPLPKADNLSTMIGISSFGMSGTNAHIVVEEAPFWESREQGVGSRENINLERPLHILALSAKTPKALGNLVQDYHTHLQSQHSSAAPLGNICFTANTGRSHFDYRCYAIASDITALSQQLEQLSDSIGKIKKQSKIAFLFTGQGSQYWGMGQQLYETSPSFRNIINECDEILEPYLETSLLTVLYGATGNRERGTENNILDQTIYTQPALFSIEYALAKLWQSWGINPDIVMGHSVGEYVAACLAGVFSLEDGLKLIAARGKLMQSLPQNGKMAVIFASEEQVKTIIENYKVEIAAVNGPNCCVISGESFSINEAIKKCESFAIETRLLNVSQAFHSALIEPMLEEFATVANQINYSVPNIAMVSTVTGKRVNLQDVSKADYWVKNSRQTVQFFSAMQTLYQEKYDIFLEIGPNPILLGMGRRCLPEETGVWLPSLRSGKSDWETMLQSLGELYRCGVAINWEGFDQDYHRSRHLLPTYPFQRQSYWFETLPSTQEPSPLPSDAFYQSVWQPQQKERRQTQSVKQDHWLIFADNKNIAVTIAQQLEKKGHHCYLVFPAREYHCISETQWEIDIRNPQDFKRLLKKIPTCDYILHLWNLDSCATEALDTETLEQDQLRNCGSILYLVQGLNTVNMNPRLWVVTQGTFEGDKEDKETRGRDLSVSQTPVWGLGRVIALEYPNLWGGLIDISTENTENIVNCLFEELLSPDIASEVALTPQKRYVSRLVEYAPCAKTPRLENNAAYLITGGLGGLGLKMATRMVKQGAKHLILIGRRQPRTEAIKTITQLEQQGVTIDVQQVDVSDADAVATLLQENCSLRGIVHLAGCLDDGILTNQTWERFTKVMSPKVMGAWNLHTYSQHLSLDFFVCFSSIASILGSPGQGNYAAANAFLDGLAHYRQSQGLPALTINWGPWAETGMAANLKNEGEKRWKTVGVELIDIAQGLETLGRLMGEKAGQTSVFLVNWQTFLQQFPIEQNHGLLKNIIQQHHLQPTVSLWEELQPLSLKKRKTLLTEKIQQDVKNSLGLQSNQSLDTQLGFFDLGMDSLMALEFRNRLQTRLGRSLPNTLTFDYPNIEAIVNYILESFEDPKITENKNNENDWEDLAQLSDEDLSAFIDNEFNQIIGTSN